MARTKKLPQLGRATSADAFIIREIAERAKTTYERKGIPCDAVNIQMDITCVHLHITKLDLPRLLAADEFNFMHDVDGINKTLDRMTFTLTKHFLPRFAR